MSLKTKDESVRTVRLTPMKWPWACRSRPKTGRMGKTQISVMYTKADEIAMRREEGVINNFLDCLKPP